MDDTAKQLRELEAQVARLATALHGPQRKGLRVILRSIEGLLIAARWEVEDQQHGPLPKYVTGDHE